MAKIKKSFKNDFEASKNSDTKKNKKNKGIEKFYSFILDISSSFFKIIGYILICILISLGATAIFNSSIRDLIFSFIFWIIPLGSTKKIKQLINENTEIYLFRTNSKMWKICPFLVKQNAV